MLAALTGALVATLCPGMSPDTSPSAVADVQLVQLSDPWRVEDATLADFDGDGRDELVIATSGTHGRARPARRLEIYAWSSNPQTGFQARLANTIDLTEDVVAFAVGGGRPGEAEAKE